MAIEFDTEEVQLPGGAESLMPEIFYGGSWSQDFVASGWEKIWTGIGHTWLGAKLKQYLVFSRAALLDLPSGSGRLPRFHTGRCRFCMDQRKFESFRQAHETHDHRDNCLTYPATAGGLGRDAPGSPQASLTVLESEEAGGGVHR
jgi:hypothetical protein